MPRLLILVPTASYRAAAFVSAAQRLDSEITLASEEPSSLGRYHPNDLIALDFDDPDGSARAMERFSAANPIDAVIGVDDQVTLAAAAIAARLSLAHNPVDAAYATRNKLEMRERLSKAGIPVPRFRAISTTHDPRDAANTVMYPSVIKPLMMAASRGVVRVDTPGQFVDAFRNVTAIVRAADAPADPASRASLLIEAYVDGWEVAVEGMLTDGRLTALAVFDKPDPLTGLYFPETIYTTPSRLPLSTLDAITAMTQDAVTALGLRHGPVHAELRGDGDQLWFIEIASRSIGGYCSKVLAFEGGLSLEDVIVRHALDPRSILPSRERQASGVMMLQAPRAGRFKKATGLERASAIDGITEIIVSAHPGQSLTPLPEGFLYLGFIFARAATPEKVEAALRAAYNRLEFVIETV